LSSWEQERVLEVLHSLQHVDQSPMEIYSTLLSRGEYFCSPRTMYRILDERAETRERRDRRHNPTHHRPELVATAPNQVWSWDITKLRTPVLFVYLFLYVILDIFSRYVVGWMIAEHATAQLAKRLISETITREQVDRDGLTLHADRGSQMIAQPVVSLCAKLGIHRSYNRPHVSNDNPFSESQFGTAKQHPSFPRRFGGIVDALTWGREFFPWYNQEHHHSGLAYLTPATVHHGLVNAVLERRARALQSAYELHPERFVRGRPTVSRPPVAVWINPPEREKAEEILRQRGILPVESEVLAQ
jgi:putative transposase